MSQNLINVYTDYKNKLIEALEKNQNRIPFCKGLIIYLKLPFYIKLIVMSLLSSLTVLIVYNIGFIIIQSKAKNEILSAITAYQNPIEYDINVIFFHSFVYLVLLIFTIFPFLGVYIFYKGLNNNIEDNYQRDKIKESGKKTLRRLLIFISTVIFFFLIYILVYVIPLIPFVMLYQSKDSSVIEVLFKYIFNNTYDSSLFQNIDYTSFYQEILYSLTLPNLITVILSLILYILWSKAKSMKSKFLKGGLYVMNFVIFLILIMILSSFTFFQWGNFGKNLSQFNVDYIKVEYYINNSLYQESGTRVYQKENYIIIRTSCNVIKYIFNENLIVENLDKKPQCTTKSK